jgi:peptidyl-prolyl cis-trans isomerase C
MLRKGEIHKVNPRMRFFLPFSLLILTGLCFSQSANKPKPAVPKAAPAAPAAAPKTEAQQPQSQEAEEQTIPTASSSSLFPSVVARVNGKAITGRDLERVVHQQLEPIGNPEWKNLREDYRGQLVYEAINLLVNQRLIYEKATANGVKATEAEIQAEYQKIAKSFQTEAEMNMELANQLSDRASLQKDLAQSIVVSKYIDETINKKITVTQEEMSKYYSAHPADFQHPDIVRASHILIQPVGNTPQQEAAAKERAEALLARVKKGEDFAKLARENSMDASASQGGDLGFATKDALGPEFGKAAFSLPIGGVALVKSQYGYHIIKVTDKKKEGLSTLEEIKDKLTDFLKNQKSEAELTKLVNQLRDQAKIEYLIPVGQQLKNP